MYMYVTMYIDEYWNKSSCPLPRYMALIQLRCVGGFSDVVVLSISDIPFAICLVIFNMLTNSTTSILSFMVLIQLHYVDLSDVVL